MDKLVDKLMLADCLQWCYYHKLQIRAGVPFTLEGTPYLVGLIGDYRILHCKKGAQVRVTTTKFIEQVHACLYGKYNQNVMYMMPTVKQVEALAKVSFDPIFDNNLWLKQYLSTNTAYVKTLNGRSIYFVGAQASKVGGSNTKDSPSLRSIPCDIVLRDELDLMDEDMVEVSRQRIRDSNLKYEANFASPTYPGYGIDALYNGSTCHKWRIKCQGCAKYTCLVESFPDSIQRIDGIWKRACVHCQREIFVTDGIWVADFPQRPEQGYWISGLESPRMDLDSDMERYYRSEGTARAEFMRSVLGIATVEADHQLTDKDIFDRCSTDLMRMTTSTETVMGVDVGDPLWCVVGLRTGDDAYEIVYASSVDSFEQLHEVADRLNVRLCVLDAMPDIHAARQFQKAEPYAVFRCHYSEQMPGQAAFDGQKGIVKCNRNEWCDKVFDVFMSRKIKLPRPSAEMTRYAAQMTHTAKTLLKNPDTGLVKPRWIKLGDDHYFHATLYFLLGASRTSPTRLDRGQRPRYYRTISSFRI